MRRYIQHLKDNKTPHERRQHAVQVAGLMTGALLVVWLGTLGVRLASQEQVAASPEQSLTAAAAASTQNKGAYIEVSTTSVYSNY
jgi:hypothetical protein